MGIVGDERKGEGDVDDGEEGEEEGGGGGVRWRGSSVDGECVEWSGRRKEDE